MYLFFDSAYFQNCLKNIPCQVLICIFVTWRTMLSTLSVLCVLFLQYIITSKLEVRCLFTTGF